MPLPRVWSEAVLKFLHGLKEDYDALPEGAQDTLELFYDGRLTSREAFIALAEFIS